VSELSDNRKYVKLVRSHISGGKFVSELLGSHKYVKFVNFHISDGNDVIELSFKTKPFKLVKFHISFGIFAHQYHSIQYTLHQSFSVIGSKTFSLLSNGYKSPIDTNQLSVST
jgi:(2Fe-2S) ferredoxin